MNAQQPRLSYKFQRLRESVRAAINNGELSGKLPGERALAKRFNANAKTISKALSDLTSEGILVRQVGRGTFVANHAAAYQALGKERRFRWITQSGTNHEQRRGIFSGAAQLAQEHGHRLKIDNIDVDANGQLPEGAVSPSTLRDTDGIVVFASHPSEGLLADFLRRHIPLVLLGSISPTVRTNVVSADYARGAYELAEHLIGMGHVDVRLVLPLPMPSVYDDATRGYMTAMRRHDLTPAEPMRLHHDLVAELLETRPVPTGLIVAGADLAGSVMDGARARSTSVPEELSLTVLSEPGETLVSHLGLTSYDVDPVRVYHWALRLLIDHAPGDKPQQVFIPGRLVDRSSVRPAARMSGMMASPREAIL